MILVVCLAYFVGCVLAFATIWVVTVRPLIFERDRAIEERRMAVAEATANRRDNSQNRFAKVDDHIPPAPGTFGGCEPPTDGWNVR